MDRAQLDFHRRLKVIEHRRRRLRHGVSYRLGRDGLIVAEPRSQFAAFPVRSIVWLLLLAFAIKFAFMAAMGVDAYSAKIATFSTGTSFDRAIHMFLQPDTVSLRLTELALPYLQ